QRVVLRSADVAPGVVARAALPHQDAAGRHAAAAVDLDAQPLAVRLAAVLRRTLTFLMRHRCLSCRLSVVHYFLGDSISFLGVSISFLGAAAFKSRDEAR